MLCNIPFVKRLLKRPLVKPRKRIEFNIKIDNKTKLTNISSGFVTSHAESKGSSIIALVTTLK